MSNIKLDISNAKITMDELMKYSDKVQNIHKELPEKCNDEKEFLGWLELPTNYDNE